VRPCACDAAHTCIASSLRVEDGVLKIDGRLDFSKYQGLLQGSGMIDEVQKTLLNAIVIIAEDVEGEALAISAAPHGSANSAPRPHRRVHTAYTQRQRRVT
jgi:hypothetical protein